jgi:hypothetical protein
MSIIEKEDSMKAYIHLCLHLLVWMTAITSLGWGESFYILGYILELIIKKSKTLKKNSSKSGKFGSLFFK